MTEILRGYIDESNMAVTQPMTLSFDKFFFVKFYKTI